MEYRGKLIDKFILSQPGVHQVQNAVSAIAVARDVQIDWGVIKKALKSFRGVKRRLEYWGKLNGAFVFDDFAHHPTAVRKTIDTVRQIYPQKRIVALFEPRTNTTVKNIFQKELTQALALADVILITPIYRPERIPAEKRLSLSKMVKILEDKGRSVFLLNSYSEITKKLSEILSRDDVLILLTNGSFGGQHKEIKKNVQTEEGVEI